MPYTPLDGQEWVDKPSMLSPIDAARLNHMEAGISGATNTAETAAADATAAGTAAGTAGADATAAGASAAAASAAAAAAAADAAGKLAAVPPGAGERTYAAIGSSATQAVAAGATVALNVNAMNLSQTDYQAATPPWATIDLVNNRIALTAAGLYRLIWRLQLSGGTAGNLFHHWLGALENIGAYDAMGTFAWSQPSSLPRLSAVRGTGGTIGGDHVVWVDAPDAALGRNRRVNAPSIQNVGAAPFNVVDARLIIERLIPTGALPSLAVPVPPPPGEL